MSLQKKRSYFCVILNKTNHYKNEGSFGTFTENKTVFSSKKKQQTVFIVV